MSSEGPGSPGGDPGFGGLCFNGHDVPAGANFCPDCGAPTPNAGRARAWPTEPPPYQAPPKPSPPPYGMPLVPPIGVYPGPAYYPPAWSRWWAARHRPLNGLAVASVVLSVLWFVWIGSILGVVFGHVALSQIRRRDERGRGFAVAGLVIGYFGVATLALSMLGRFAFGAF